MFYETGSIIFLFTVVIVCLIPVIRLIFFKYFDVDVDVDIPVFAIAFMIFLFASLVATVKYEYQPIDQSKIGRINGNVVYIPNDSHVTYTNKASLYNAPNDKLYVQKSYTLFGICSYRVVAEEERDIPEKK